MTGGIYPYMILLRKENNMKIDVDYKPQEETLQRSYTGHYNCLAGWIPF